VINAEFGKQLGIDLDKCSRALTGGIVGEPVTTYVAEIDIEIANFPNSQKTVKVEFIKSKNVPILLGQHGFFDNFKVTFERFNNFFEVDLKP
jgi:hypothetical protein